MKVSKTQLDLESQILHDIIYNVNLRAVAFERLDEKYFFGVKNKKLFKILYNHYKQRLDSDIFLILKEFNDVPFITGLDRGNTSGGLEFVFINRIDVLIEYWLKFEIDRLFKESVNDIDVFERIDRIQLELNQLKLVNTRDYNECIDLIKIFEANLKQAKGGTNIIPTGFIDFDHDFGGFGRGELIVIAGRPSQGKTAFALDCARYQCKQGISVALFSFEMDEYWITQRLYCKETGFNLNDIRRGKYPSEDEYTKFCQEFQTWKFYTDFSRHNELSLSARIKSMKQHHDIDIVYIDYLDFIKSTNNNQNLAVHIGSITKELKTTSKELNIPIVLLVQLNRESSKSLKPTAPKLHDLRNSGEIEQDADMVLFVYRPEQEDHEFFAGEPKISCIGRARIQVRKNRNGNIGYVTLDFIKESAKFANQNMGFNDAAF